MIVRSCPTVATRVNTDGIDIAQVHMLEVKLVLGIEVDTIHIGGNPHAVLLVTINLAKGIVSYGCLVVLLRQELTHLTTLHVDHTQTVMVSGQPKHAMTIGHHIP